MQLVGILQAFYFMDTIQVDIPLISVEQGEIIVAELSEINFHGFQENKNVLSAFINSVLFEENILQSVLSNLNVNYTKKTIAESNWNQQWENGFQPVIIDSFVGLRAGFHLPIKGVMHEIVITPKMSFGTGHHPTTYLMLQEMKEIDFEGKSVLDFGTGTGVLAILASKLGANTVTAVDNDEWGIRNAGENFYANNCNNILLLKNHSIDHLGAFDIILSNINLNVIKANIVSLKQACLSATELLLSGFLLSDENELKPIFSNNGFQSKAIKQRDGWICVRLCVGK